MPDGQTHPTTPISDGDLQIAREAAAHVYERKRYPLIAKQIRDGKDDDCAPVSIALRALALSRASNPPPDTAVVGELWQPISTAPTHGKRIWVRRKDGVVCQLYANPEWKESEALSHYEEWCPMPVPNRLRADADAELEELSVEASQAALARQVLSDYRSARLAPASSGQGDADGWRDDPSADDRWNAGLDFGQTQLCAVLRVDPATVNWDAATETLDGDVQSVIRGILTAGLGEDWLEQRLLPAAPVEPGR